MKHSRVFVLFMILALALFACREDEPTPTPVPHTPAPAAPEATQPAEEPEPPMAGPEDIVGIFWQWEAFRDTAGQNDLDVEDPALYTVSLLPEGQASIKADCNMVTMGYSLEGSSISFVGPGISTLAFCGEESLDQQFLGYLENVATWVMSPDEKLVFNLMADAGDMIFGDGGLAEVPAAEPMAAEPGDIVGISWQWEAFQDTAELNDIAVGDPAQYTISLLPEGQASIKADCNMVTMDYELEGSSISFTGPGISTLAFCGEDSLDQQFLGFLENVVSWVMSPEEKLVFNLMADAGNMLFDNGGPAEAAPATAIEDIQNIEWQWSALVETEPAAQSVVPDSENYTIAFMADDTVALKADCNQAAGSYSAEGSSLTIVLGPATAAFCGEESLDQQFLSLVTTVDSFEVDGQVLRLMLAGGAGEMQFAYGKRISSLDIDPSQISLDAQDLAGSWEAHIVEATPYDESQPPGPMGMPEHIEITFDGTTPDQKDPSDPVIYLIPVDTYKQQWEENGNDSITTSVDGIYNYTVALPYPSPISNMPVLPMEELSGVNDVAVQVGRVASTESSATKNGYRFVGRFAQDMNPVTSDGLPLRYIYQGFTNDGKYLVLFFYTVNSSALPTNEQVADEFNEALNTEGGYDAYLRAQVETIDDLATTAWEPDLAALDALVGSLVIDGMAESGIQGQVWQLSGQSSQPGGEISEAGGSLDYLAVYERDGTLFFQADCNNGVTGYDVTGGMVGGLAVQPAAVTLVACGPDSDSDLMINGLTASQDYRVHPGGAMLELVRPAGGGSLFFISLGAGEGVDTELPEVELPEPEPGDPAGTVVSLNGLNIRSGPGTIYPIVGWAPNGASGEIIGRSADGKWWATPYIQAPGGIGWASAAYVAAANVEEVPVIPAPPPPAPTPTPTPEPAPSIQFWADRTVVNQGECTTLNWQVENVQAVWFYQAGQPYDQFPTTGTGSQQVCPVQTTTYELRVEQADGTIQIRQVTIVVHSANPLANTSWVLSSMYINQVPIPNTTLTASFEVNNNLSGSAGCNNYTGPYVASGNAISIGPLDSTNASCADDVNAQEEAYLTALRSARTYQLVGSQLILRDAGGNEVARFNRTG